MSLTPDQVAFLERFSKSPDCAALVQVLQAEVVKVDAKLRTLRGEDLLNAQGCAQQLDTLIAMLTKRPTAARSVQRPVRQDAHTV